MAKITEFEDRKRVIKDIVVEKAARHGESSWGFDYRGQEVIVSAKKGEDGKIRTHTDSVKNKGK